MLLILEKGQRITRKEVLSKLVEILYDRNDLDFRRGTFRVRGDVIEVYPTYEESAFRIEMFGDEVESLSRIDPLLGEVRETFDRLPIYPKTHYVMSRLTKEVAIESIKAELESWRPQLEKQGKLVEAQRLHQRTMFDLEMIKEIGYCHGIENYSRHFSGRLPGEASRPRCSITSRTIRSCFSMRATRPSRSSTACIMAIARAKRFWWRTVSVCPALWIIARSRSKSSNIALIRWSMFRPPPGPYELTKSGGVIVEQIIRPTGLLDPEVEVRPIRGQVDDLLHEIRLRTANNQRVLVTTLTKRMAEDLSEYYAEAGVKCNYLHSEVSTLDRIKILRDLRRGEHDVLIGINLLREGLDLPEVSLVAILDADKEGFLRSTGSLIQTMGRAARHLEGRAILYADVMTDSMKRAIGGETNRRRIVEVRYNEANNITPQSIIKPIDMMLVAIAEGDYVTVPAETEADMELAPAEREKLIDDLERAMREAIRKFEFERAAQLRDRIKQLRVKDVAGIGIPG